MRARAQPAPVCALHRGEGLALNEPRRLHSGELLGAGKEVEILHGSQRYRLRLTSLGKLILTK